MAYKLACMADRPEMFGPTRGFSGMDDSMEPCKMLWGRPCVAMVMKFGLGAEIQSPTSLSMYISVCVFISVGGWDPFAYRVVCLSVSVLVYVFVYLSM